MTRLTGYLSLLAVAGLLAGCRAEVEDPGRLPPTDVEGGHVPDIASEPAPMNITTDTQRVEVPGTGSEFRRP